MLYLDRQMKLYAWIRKSILILAESLFRLFRFFWLADFLLSLQKANIDVTVPEELFPLLQYCSICTVSHRLSVKDSDWRMQLHRWGFGLLRVYYHVTYFAFPITPPDRLSKQCFGPHLLFQQKVDFSLTIMLLFTCFFPSVPSWPPVSQIKLLSAQWLKHKTSRKVCTVLRPHSSISLQVYMAQHPGSLSSVTAWNLNELGRSLRKWPQCTFIQWILVLCVALESNKNLQKSNIYKNVMFFLILLNLQ